jgi:hypothetical protein
VSKLSPSTRLLSQDCVASRAYGNQSAQTREQGNVLTGPCNKSSAQPAGVRLYLLLLDEATASTLRTHDKIHRDLALLSTTAPLLEHAAAGVAEALGEDELAHVTPPSAAASLSIYEQLKTALLQSPAPVTHVVSAGKLALDTTRCTAPLLALMLAHRHSEIDFIEPKTAAVARGHASSRMMATGTSPASLQSFAPPLKGLNGEAAAAARLMQSLR